METLVSNYSELDTLDELDTSDNVNEDFMYEESDDQEEV